MTTLSNSWIIYFDGKHNYEYENKRFWCKPNSIIRPMFTNFKKLFITLAIPNISNNQLTIKSNDETLYTSSVLDKDIEIVLPNREEYIFESLLFCSPNKVDRRELGVYFLNIQVSDNDNFLHFISYKNMISFDVRYIRPFVV